jgi:hypothetical protein
LKILSFNQKEQSKDSLLDFWSLGHRASKMR